MPDHDGPRLVASHTEAELVREQALNEVSWALQELTSNLIRVVRGAGRPLNIVGDASAFLTAVVSYHEKVGHWPLAHEVSAMLSVDEIPERLSGPKEGHHMMEHAKERIVRGALQQVASRLVGQLTQRRVGEREMYEGIHDLEAARDELRREREAPTPRAAPAARRKAGSAKEPSTG